MIEVAATAFVGLWKFREMKAPPAPAYRPMIAAPAQMTAMVYELGEKGESRLRWELLDAGKYCERRSHWEFKDGQIFEKIESVDPGSDGACSADPDMEVGKTTQTPARVENEELILTLPVGEDSIEYIFERGT